MLRINRPHKLLLATTSVVLLLALPAVSSSAKPPKFPPPSAAVTIIATPNPLTFGQPLTLSGQLTTTTNGVTTAPTGVAVTLESAPYPYLPLTPFITTATTPGGAYTATDTPAFNTEYLVKAASKPAATSVIVLVQVSTRVSFHLSTTRPRAGTRVRFSGTVSPAKSGQVVLIQRLTGTGTFVTVATSLLYPAGNGTASTYNRTLRIRHSGTYRVVKSHDIVNAIGISAPHHITVHP